MATKATTLAIPPACNAMPAAVSESIANQIYDIVNDVFQQVTGNKELSAVDTNSLVAMGKTLDDTGKMDIWLNSLSRRIAFTYDSYRMYVNDMVDMYRTSFEWGAIVQKLYVRMPQAKEDLAYRIGELDGQSVDQYIINNPEVSEKFFDKVTPYSFFITIQDFLLREAFTGPAGMNSLIRYIFGQVSNMESLTLENLGRYTLANLAVNITGPQQIHVLTMYNTETGQNLTALAALNDAGFLGFLVATIYKYSDLMKKISVLFNKEAKERHTPRGLQRLYLLGDIDYKMGTVAKAYAFNKEYLNTPIKAQAVPYWNAPKSASGIFDWPTLSTVTGTDITGAEKTVSNVIAVLCDRDALGTFKETQRVATTPLNARGLYYNTFWHERQMWFNDLGENAIMFMLD